MPRSIEVEIISQLEVEIIGMKFSGGHVECVEGNQFTIIKYNKKRTTLQIKYDLHNCYFYWGGTGCE